MAARLLLLFVVMLVFATLYGCAQEAAKDRQPIKRVKEPTTAEIAPHAPKESDGHVRRAKKAGVVVHAGNSEVVARAGEAVVRVGGFRTAKAEAADATAPSREVTLKIEGTPGTELSGTCRAISAGVGSFTLFIGCRSFAASWVAALCSCLSAGELAWAQP